MTYVEGFLTAVPTANRQAYLAHAQKAAALVREFGATRFVEAWGDDVPRGTVNDLWGAVQAKDDETVLFSWFEYPDKATRDAANQRMMDDPRMAAMADDMPFDGTRMIYAGFDVVHAAGDGGDTGYIDGVVTPARTDGKAAYRDYAQICATVLLAAGALRVVDAFGDDIRDGTHTDFNRAIRREDGETAVFGWIEWPSKAVRDAGWSRVMAESAMQDAGPPPFDGKRMIFGGFVPLLDA